jgi:hypothetical protein
MGRRLRKRAIILGAAAVLFVGAGVAWLTTSLSSIGASSGKEPGATQVQFVVTGSAPNGVDVRYGDDASNYRGSLPLNVTKSIQENAVYWVMAQLQGGGRITCKVILGRAVRTGHATGGYNTCTAHSPGDSVIGWN